MSAEISDRQPPASAWRMSNGRLAPLVIGLSIALLGAAAAQAQDAAQNDKGRDLALMVCSPCHIVTPHQDASPIFNGPPKPPSFHDIANRPGTSAETLDHFLTTTHSTVTLPIHMPDPELMPDQRQAVIGFILSLKDQAVPTPGSRKRPRP